MRPVKAAETSFALMPGWGEASPKLLFSVASVVEASGLAATTTGAWTDGVAGSTGGSKVSRIRTPATIGLGLRQYWPLKNWAVTPFLSPRGTGGGSTARPGSATTAGCPAPAPP